jgi:DNA polymerase-1
MLNAIKEHQPSHIAVSFDIGRTFRDDLYAEYKAGRGETPAEFHPQLEHIKQMMRAFSIPIYVAEGFEADDVLGTLARQATQQGVETLILTGDSDTLQLVDQHVHVLLANPFGQRMTSIEYDLAKVIERYDGLQPNQLADLRGLKGDSSDNIPGVKGIGEKGAITLLNLFGTVENIYAQFDAVPNRYKKVLDGQLDAALFSKKLATIVTDAPVTLELADCDITGYDKQEVIRFFQLFEIGKTLISRLPPSKTMATATVPLPESTLVARTKAPNQQLDMFGDNATAPAPIQHNLNTGYRTVLTVTDIQELVESCIHAGEFAFDTETTGTSVFRDQLIGISIACRDHHAWYVPIVHDNVEVLPTNMIRDALAPIFSNPAIRKYAHNAKFDIEALLQLEMVVDGLAFDTMLAASLLDKRRGLKDLAFYELQLTEEPTNIDELIGKGKNQTSLNHIDITAVTNYAASDADYTLQLTKRLAHTLAQQPTTQSLFTDLELPLIDVLVTMERHGIMIDIPYLAELSQRTGQRLATLEQEIYGIAGMSFNVASGDQLSDVLFGKLGLPTAGLEKTKTGRWSLNADALERLREHDQTLIIERILQHRQLSQRTLTHYHFLQTPKQNAFILRIISSVQPRDD